MTAGRETHVGWMKLWHFSDDPDIAVFHPHVARTSAIRDQAYVWAIDQWHAPMYYLPRDCPRACFWAGERTTPLDRERWLHGGQARFVMAVEARWLERIREAVLYRYQMPPDTFAPLADAEDSGHYVSRQAVVPAAVQPMRDLLNTILGEGVELRVLDRLGPLWSRVHRDSTLHHSGTRVRGRLSHHLR